MSEHDHSGAFTIVVTLILLQLCHLAAPLPSDAHNTERTAMETRVTRQHKGGRVGVQ